MSGEMFAPAPELLTGALTGLVFGFLLQKGGVTRFQTILGQFLMKDFTVLKVMLTAIVVGGVGIYGMPAAGLEIAMHVKGTQVLANVAGGLIFGVGMAVLGYCPGTGVAALGDGSRHAIFGVLGMLFGAAVFAWTYPWIADHVLNVGDFGKETLATWSHASPWAILLPLAGAAAVGFTLLELVERRRTRAA